MGAKWLSNRTNHNIFVIMFDIISFKEKLERAAKLLNEGNDIRPASVSRPNICEEYVAPATIPISGRQRRRNRQLPVVFGGKRSRKKHRKRTYRKKHRKTKQKKSYRKKHRKMKSKNLK